MKTLSNILDNNQENTHKTRMHKAQATPLAVTPPGRPLSFQEALKVTLSEDKELLSRLAK